MRTIPVYQILAEDIKGLGVDTVFGLMSDDICQLFATLDAMGVRIVGARHETNAVMMAAGYAAATGKLGVALIGRGPAMANAMHGMISGAKAGLPILIISGDAPLARGAMNALGPDLKAFPAATIVRARAASRPSCPAVRMPDGSRWPMPWPRPLWGGYRCCCCPPTCRWDTPPSPTAPRRWCCPPCPHRNPPAGHRSTPPWACCGPAGGR